MGHRQEDIEKLVEALRVDRKDLAREGFEAGMSREAVERMCEQADLLQELRCPEPIVLDAGFTARVMARIEAEKPSSIWDLFVSPALAKQLSFAALVLMAMLAGFLFARSSDESVMARHTQETLMRVEHPENLGMDRQQDRQNMLATLASYRSGGE
jgi:hypothetical protein